jgi:hypothetical protein
MDRGFVDSSPEGFDRRRLAADAAERDDLHAMVFLGFSLRLPRKSHNLFDSPNGNLLKINLCLLHPGYPLNDPNPNRAGAIRAVFLEAQTSNL